MMRRALGALLFGCYLLSTSAAFAADPTSEDIAQARSLGEQGQAAFDAKNFPEAEKLFGAAAKIYPLAPTLSLGLARAEAAQGKLISARETYNRIVRDNAAANPNASAVFKAAVDSARTEGDALAARIGNVTITIDGGKDPKVTIDDVPVPAVVLGLKRPVDPGEHKIHVTADGFKAADRVFTIVEGASVDQKISLVKDDSVAVTPPPVGTAQNPPVNPPPPVDDHPSSGSSRKTIGYVVGGVGVAGLIVGAITGIVAMGDKSDLDKNSACNPSTKLCTSAAHDAISSYNTMGGISTVGFIAGGVLLATGAVFIFTAPKETKTAYVTPYLGLGSAGLTGRF